MIVQKILLTAAGMVKKFQFSISFDVEAQWVRLILSFHQKLVGVRSWNKKRHIVFYYSFYS